MGNLRPRHFAFLFSSVLVLASLFLISKMERPATPKTLPTRHPVDDRLRGVATKKEAAKAPEFSGVTADSGETITFSKIRGSQPAVVVFILFDCPCSIEAQPLFNKLQTSYLETVRFIGVVQGKTDLAKQFAGETSAVFPLVSDPENKIAESYNAERSVFVALVDSEGTLVKMYAGYGKEMAKDLNDRLAKMTQTQAPALDLTELPDREASGCRLDWAGGKEPGSAPASDAFKSLK